MKDTLQVSKGAVKLNIKGTIEGYRERYGVLAGDASRVFRHKIYVVTPGNRHVVHVKVPSETVDNFAYDVLIEFSADKGTTKLEDCDIKIFSNCPSFVYTSAYVFAHWDPGAGKATRKGKGMLIDSLKRKLPEDRLLMPGSEKKLPTEAVKDKPEVRNPAGLPLFDKSIYYAIFYIQENLTVEDIVKNRTYIAEAKLLASIDQFDTLMNKRKAAAAKTKGAKEARTKSVKKDFETQEKNLNTRNLRGLQKPLHALAPKRVTSSPKRPSAPKRMSRPKSGGRI